MGHTLLCDEEHKNQSFISQLVEDATLILPIISPSLEEFNDLIPEELRKYNGLSIAKEGEELAVQKIVSNILEGFNFLRKSRRVFISYKRDESNGVAIQLYEKLEENGFDVFLDTHSIKKSEPFQEELWHRMTDSDVLILLNTYNFLKSDWTKEELAKANSLSLGIIQLIWPNSSLIESAQICLPLKLQDNDFYKKNYANNAKLMDGTVIKIISDVESIRARTLASRQDSLTSEFMKFAQSAGLEPVLNSHKFITLNKNEKELIIIPTVGIPHSYGCDEARAIVKQVKENDSEEIYLLYDQIYIRDHWLNHLNWLNNYLPVRTKELQKVKEWLNN